MEANKSRRLLDLLTNPDAKEQLQRAILNREETITSASGEVYKLRVRPVPPSKKFVTGNPDPK